MASPSPKTTVPSLTFLARDDVNSFATVGGIVLCLGRNPPTAQAAERFVENVEKGLGRLAKGGGLIVVVHDRSTPEPEARESLKRAFPSLSRRVVGTAFVLRAKGFVSAAQRAMITAFMLATGNKNKVLATSDIEEAVKWIYARLPADALAKTGPAEEVASEIIAFCDEELSKSK